MVRKKKKTVKKIKEDEFDVELTKNVAGAPQTTTKSISGATSAADAVTKAKQGDTEQYDKITAKKKEMGAGAPIKTARTAAKTDATTTGMVGLDTGTYGLGESKKKTVRKKKTETRKRRTGVKAFKLTESYKNTRFNYPYSIALPQAFDTLVEEVVEKSEDVKLTERYARLYIQVPNAKAMDTFMENLVKKAKGKGKDPKAETIINGIMGSVK